MAQTVQNLPAMQDTWVRSLGQEDPLEKEMATNSSILVWRIPWTKEPGGLQSIGLQGVRHNRGCREGNLQIYKMRTIPPTCRVAVRIRVSNCPNTWLIVETQLIATITVIIQS